MKLRRHGSREHPCTDPLHQLAALIGEQPVMELHRHGAPPGVTLFLPASQLPAHLKPAAARILYGGKLINRRGLREPAQVLDDIAREECTEAGWPYARP